MLFSIIVPIYKVEEYLAQCIDSVLKQLYSDFELILVDDGTPDKSGIICDEYAQKDNRICVLHKKNGGLSDARNAGLSLAKGKFICFLDSDDYMTEDALNNLANLIMKNHDLDMITCAHVNEYIDGNTTSVSLPIDSSTTSCDRNEFLNILYKSNGAYWAAWKNIFKKSIIEKYNLKFIKGLIGAEDCDFFMRFARHGKKFAFLNTPIVNYRIDREGSITNTMSKEAIMGQLIVFSNNYYALEANNDMKAFFANKFSNTVYIIYHLSNLTEIDEVTNYIKARTEILRDTKSIKYSIAKLVWRMFGFYKGSKILHNVH